MVKTTITSIQVTEILVRVGGLIAALYVICALIVMRTQRGKLEQTLLRSLYTFNN